MRKLRIVVTIAAMALCGLALACGGQVQATPAPKLVGEGEERQLPRPTQASLYRAAPELEGLTTWFNSEPTTIAELGSKGRVVLIDFWTYTCVNCIRTLPYLKVWDERYRDHGLTIIGVHSPEFEFEKVTENVRTAVTDFGLQYAVAQDNEMATWRAFNNAYWPAKYLIDAGGGIRYQHFGEGQYLETERQIRAALRAAGWDVSGIPEGGYEAPVADPTASTITRELYGGYDRNYGLFGSYAGQELYYRAPDQTHLYEDDEIHAHNKWYLKGLWRNEAEAIVHARTTTDLEDYIVFKMAGRSANVVINPVEPGQFDVIVEIDGRPLQQDEAGADIVFDESGRSILRVEQARLYRFLELPQFGIREVKLRSNSDSFAIFAFTFGNYQDGA